MLLKTEKVVMVLLRHGSRSAHALGDSSLNPGGRAQAENLPRRLTPHGALPMPSQLFCSPKRRTRETLEPLAAATQLLLEADSRLDERRQSEAMSDFKARIRSFIAEIAGLETVDAPDSGHHVVYACTHMDWLEVGIPLLDSNLNEIETSMGWAAGEFRVFSRKSAAWIAKAHGVLASQSADESNR